ncbi:MAG: permease-like cell division protein FtsX [Thermaerobacter sp.]|nr:ABC transporter permease [Bacillota bacterium]REJ33723.1 MAG: ABC transporter permease [Bacillota bacterium]
MRANAWGYVFGEALRSLWRNGFMSLASVTTVAICLAVLAIILLVAVNLQYMASFVESQVEVVAFVDGSVDRAATRDLEARIEALPGVREAVFVSREAALERLKEQFGEHRDLLAGLEDPEANPLRDSFEVRLAGAQYAAAVAGELERMDGIEEVMHRQDVVDRLLAITQAVRTGGLVLVALLAAATVFIISNTIRLTVYARRHQVGIMKLVGATDGFIRWPFFLEGLMLGVLGAAVAGAAAWMGYDLVVETLTAAIPFIPILEQQPLLGNLMQLLLVLGAVIGAMGSTVSVRRFLRV